MLVYICLHLGLALPARWKKRACCLAAVAAGADFLNMFSASESRVYVNILVRKIV